MKDFIFTYLIGLMIVLVIVLMMCFLIAGLALLIYHPIVFSLTLAPLALGAMFAD